MNFIHHKNNHPCLENSLVITAGLRLFLSVFVFIFFGVFLLSKSEAKTPRSITPKRPSLEVMAGSMIMVGFRGLELKKGDPFLELVSRGHVGHVVLFDKDMPSGGVRNVSSPTQLRDLTKSLTDAAPGPFFVAVDQEGGMVRRLRPENGFMALSSARNMGRATPENTLILARNMGQELAELGIHVDFAPVVDIDNQDNPIIGRMQRSFSSDPNVVAKHALAFGHGLEESGVIPVLKHFPGHGATVADSHLGPAKISDKWDSKKDLWPYIEAFKNNWSGMVMVGHLDFSRLDSKYPASLSYNIVNDLLRTALGFSGVVISDDYNMASISSRYSLEETILLAVNAGVDILLFGNNAQKYDPQLPEKIHSKLVQLVKEEKISRERIVESWQRINILYEKYFGKVQMPGSPSLVRIH